MHGTVGPCTQRKDTQMVQKRIAMVAHDERKQDMLEWLERHSRAFVGHQIIGTGTTAGLIANTFRELNVHPLKSGPLGGDQQLGAMIAEGKLDVLFFFTDPMTPQPHDVDIKALLRLAVLYNVPTACNKSSADFIINSPLFAQDYKPELKDYSQYLRRKL